MPDTEQKIKQKNRFAYIDQFRGFVGVLMLMGHSSYYLNDIWHHLDPFEPLFPSWGQFALRYAGYLCAPGFLMMAGAMVWWAYQRRVRKGLPDWPARWQLIQRGIFLIIVQMTIVNSSWGGFKTFNPWHLGIIATIGMAMIFLTLIIRWKWYYRLIFAIFLLLLHPFLLQIDYETSNIWQKLIFETFVDSGSFNKYPVIPWFALAILGSVMANGWLELWKSDRRKIIMGMAIALLAFGLAIIIRLQGTYGNISPFSEFGTYSFFLDQKYPPSLFMNLWFFGAIVLGVTIFIMIGKISPKILWIFSIPGKVPLFFYVVHLAILGVFVKRIDFFYREGGITETFIGLLVIFLIMIPLCIWFFGVKKRSKNYIIRMI